MYYNNYITIDEKDLGRVFITSDEHYGSERTLKLSRRPFKSVPLMDGHIINCFNEKTDANSLTIHNGDFGDMSKLKYLYGDHILIWGNYEMEDFLNDPDTGAQLSSITKTLLRDPDRWDIVQRESPKTWDSTILTVSPLIESYNDMLKKKYGWKDVYSSFPSPRVALFIKYNKPKNITTNEYVITHRPLDCIMGLFNLYGHIHGRQLVKTYGLDVGVDGHHFFPLSLIDDVPFFKEAIEKFYDDNVFE